MARTSAPISRDCGPVLSSGATWTAVAVLSLYFIASAITQPTSAPSLAMQTTPTATRPRLVVPPSRARPIAAHRPTPTLASQIQDPRRAPPPLPAMGTALRLPAVPLALGAALTGLLALALSPARRFESRGHGPSVTVPFAMATATGTPSRKVLVTGAGGRTGRLVVQKLLAAPGTEPLCLVHSDKSVKALLQLGVPASSIRVASVTEPGPDLQQAFDGCDAVILCSSAVPKIQLLSIARIFLRKCFRQDPGRPTFTFPPGGSPEEVDWLGVKNQVDAAKAAGVRQFVMVSSMGGTQPENFLNTIGKQPDGTGGDILLWKRKGERYLIDSGVPYTIVHPGGLLDEPGGERELVFGVDDKLLNEPVRSIPRADVAEVSVRALTQPAALNRSFDIISRPKGEGAPTQDFSAFFATQGDCDYSL